ncbi:MAG: YkvA family protein [Clostridia bacterium]|nr:YkvA family protein [Clostridia bacterium]
MSLDHMPPEEPEQLVRKGFLSKVKKTAGKVPFVPDAVAMHYCAMDPATPLHARAVAFSALAYFVLPVDLIPDAIPGAGFADDASAVWAAIRSLAPYITDEHRRKAADWLGI